MTESDTASILEAIRVPYRLSDSATANPLGNGLINQTLLVRDAERLLVAQRINTFVFQDPAALVHNACAIVSHLEQKQQAPGVARHLPGEDGRFLHGEAKDIRVLEYIHDSHSIEVVESAGQARELAFTFASFSRSLSDFDHGGLTTVIPDFHNSTVRYGHFLQAMQGATEARIAACYDEIEFAKKTRYLIAEWQSLVESLPIRVCHNDCKINNILLSRKSGKTLAVIDLDTCMQGSLITDFGDLVRSCCSPEAEDSTALEQVIARPDVFGALVEGYLGGLDGVIEARERTSLIAGALMICFIQGIRFLTDFLNGDSYFGADYPLHNLDRARNQFQLFRSLRAQEPQLREYIYNEGPSG